MKHLVFLLCTERSGSNFITSMMNGHSQVSGPPPTHLFRLFLQNRENYGQLEVDRNWKLLIDDMVDCFNHKLCEWSTTLQARRLNDSVSERSVMGLLRFIYEHEARFDGASHIFIKENHTHRFADYLAEQDPSIKFVFMTRDPRDVAASWLKTDSIPGGVAEAVDIWLKDQTASFQFYDRWLSDGRVLHIRYEDLVNDTVPALNRLTRFMGLEFEDKMMAFHNAPRTVLNAGRIEAWANLKRPVMTGNTRKYVNVLSETDRLFVELSCHELMSRSGYECDLKAKFPGAQDTQAVLSELSSNISRGSYQVRHPDEQQIRNDRLAAIQRVISRRL